MVWHHSSHTEHGWLSRGYLGVQLFFAISGVLITTLLLRERERKGQVALKEFYIRRTLRIFPLYYAVIALYFALVWLTERNTERGHAFFHHLPAFLTYTSNWFVSLGAGSSVIFYFAWSLATEEQFYLFWPSVIRFSRRWVGPTIVMTLVLLAGESARWARAHQLVPPDLLMVKVLASIATSICLGSLCAVLLHYRAGFNFAYRMAGQNWSVIVALVLLALTFTLQAPDIWVALVMVYVVACCVVREDHALRRVLANRGARYIGSISYGMYLLHVLALNIVRKVVGRDVGDIGLFAATTVLAIAAASLSYYTFEKPFLNLKKRFAS